MRSGGWRHHHTLTHVLSYTPVADTLLWTELRYPNFDSPLDECVFIGEFILNIVAYIYIFFLYLSDPYESPVFQTAIRAELVHDSRFQQLVKLSLELPSTPKNARV